MNKIDYRYYKNRRLKLTPNEKWNEDTNGVGREIYCNITFTDGKYTPRLDVGNKSYDLVPSLKSLEETINLEEINVEVCDSLESNSTENDKFITLLEQGYLLIYEFAEIFRDTYLPNYRKIELVGLNRRCNNVFIRYTNSTDPTELKREMDFELDKVLFDRDSYIIEYGKRMK